MKFENIGKSVDSGLSTLVKKFNEKKPSKENLLYLGHKAKALGMGVTAAAFGMIAEKSMDVAVKLSEKATPKAEKPADTHEIQKNDVEGLSDLFPNPGFPYTSETTSNGGYMAFLKQYTLKWLGSCLVALAILMFMWK